MAAVVGGAIVLAGGVPGGIYGTGISSGCLIALQAISLVFVYRANRIINFALIPTGGAAGLIFSTLVTHRVFIAGLGSICGPCLPQPANVQAYITAHPDIISSLPVGATGLDVAVATAPNWMVAANYWLSLLIALVLAVGLVAILYFLLIKKFAAAPRLILTIITIAAGGLLVTIPSQIIRLVYPHPGGASGAASLALPIPWHFYAGGIRFGADDVASAAVLLITATALYLFLRYTSMGIALRAASENALRASTVGMNVTGVGFRAWFLAGLLAALASLLATANGLGGGGASVYQPLVIALAAALVGGLVSLPLAAVGGIAVGVLQEVLLFHANIQGLLPLLLLGVIVVMQMAQRARTGRADIEAEASWTAAREVRPTPMELRRLPAVRKAMVGLVALLTIFVGAYPWIVSSGQVTLGTATLAEAIIGLSLLVLTGWAGQISLGQMAFAAVGAWVAAVLGWPMILAILAGGVAGAVGAVIVGLPALRLRGQQLAVSTLALGLVAEQVLLGPEYLAAKLPAQLQRPVFLGIDFGDGRAFYYLTLVFLVVTVFAVLGLRRGRFARAAIAARDNEQAVQAFGVNLLRVRLTAFAISGFLAAVAGGLIAYAQLSVQQSAFASTQGVDMFQYSVIGGLGSVTGPILGMGWAGMQAITGSTGIGYLTYYIGPGAGVILVMLFFPGGLSQIWFGIRDAWLRRVADRHRIVVPSLYADRVVDPSEGLPISPKLSPTGGEAFTPLRYRLDGQWMVDTRRKEKANA